MQQPAMREFERLQEAAQFLKQFLNEPPRIGLVLGSGLSNVLGSLQGERRIKFSEIPHFPKPTVAGHAGEFVYGRLEEQWVLAQKGRVHYYEGYEMRELAFAVRVMRLAGVETLIVTNAAGGINEKFSVGDFVLIRDHINLIPDNPLRGANVEELGPRFPNLLDAYSQELRARAKQAAQRVKLTVQEGVYIALPGPMYETPAEIQAYQRWGADLVGMSTVPEVIAARHCGMRVLAISVVTNMAAGIDPGTQLTHEEVLETTKRREQDFTRLIRAIVQGL
jgi:purine-nucleoside phosphorylase